MELLPVPTYLELVLQMALALVLGIILGTERTVAGKMLGMRAYGLVSLAACLFVILGVFMSSTYIAHFDVSPIGIVLGIIITAGLWGVGLIVVNGRYLQGVAAAAYLLLAGGIGAAVGFGLYVPAMFATLMIYVALFAGAYFEERLKPHASEILLSDSGEPKR